MPRLPYDQRSPWYQPIPANALTHASSTTWINAIADNKLPLTCDVKQYSIPVYLVNSNTPYVEVSSPGGFFGFYDGGDQGQRRGANTPWKVMAPIPAGAEAGVGTDGQIILWDEEANIEWAFWQMVKLGPGQYGSQNGYRTTTGSGTLGMFKDGKAGRGAGTTYLAGLVRPWEVYKRGYIAHALPFAYAYPSKTYIYPATKTDGRGVFNVDPPEGARLQLDPTLDLDTLGLHPSAKILARALQTYGMYVIDNSGSSKIIMEAQHTALWGPEFTRGMLSALPWNRFRVVLAPNAVVL